MTMTVGDFLVERLSEWGVTRIFGYPGDGINGVFGAMSRAKGKIEFVQARHEEMAAFMASAHAKFTGELGVCIATSGPGASHLITGLYDARMDHMPVLAIVGQQARTALGSHYQQELDLVSMFKDVAGAFVQQASAPSPHHSAPPGKYPPAAPADKHRPPENPRSIPDCSARSRPAAAIHPRH